VINDTRLAIVDRIYDSDTTEVPFGKRWAHECVTLDAETLTALQQGKLIAIDVRDEYVIYIRAGDIAGPSSGNPLADCDEARATGRGSD
jgi:hypothetical protein